MMHRYDVVASSSDRLLDDVRTFLVMAAKADGEADALEAEAAEKRRYATTLRDAADESEAAARTLTPIEGPVDEDQVQGDLQVVSPGDPGEWVFETVGSTYRVDDRAKTWARTPGAHGPSGVLPRDSGEFSERSLIAVGMRVVIDDIAIGTFRTSVVRDVRFVKRA